MTAVPYEATLHVRDTCLCLATQRAARALARLFDEALRPLDLRNGQFSLLMSLNRPAPATMSSVVSLLAMDRTTLTAALKPLQRRGLVRVGVDPDDRRGRLLSLTVRGGEILAQALPIWRQHHDLLERRLPLHDTLHANLALLGDPGGKAKKTPSVGSGREMRTSMKGSKAR
jgi:DNA-binding MarR family transcriptional regulator